MFHATSIHVVSEGYRIVVEHSVSGRKEVEINNLRRRPYDPLGYVQFVSLLSHLVLELGETAVFQHGQRDKEHAYAKRRADQLIHYDFF